MKYAVMCPQCPKSYRECADTFEDVLRIAREEQPKHMMCGGQVWAAFTRPDTLKKGEPFLWHPDGEAHAWKDIEPDPITVFLPDGQVVNIRFPVGTDEDPFPQSIIELGNIVGMN